MDIIEKLKAFTWKQWLGWAMVLLMIIVAIVLHLIQPRMPYSVFEFALLVSFILGGVTSCLLHKGKEKTTEKQLLTD